MCLALPARVISLDPVSQSGQVDLGGMRKNVSFALLDEVALDGYVIVHVGYALPLDAADNPWQRRGDDWQP